MGLRGALDGLGIAMLGVDSQARGDDFRGVSAGTLGWEAWVWSGALAPAAAQAYDAGTVVGQGYGAGAAAGQAFEQGAAQAE